MPVRIRNVYTASQHTIVANRYFTGGRQPYARANQAVIPYFDALCIFVVGPDGKIDLHMGRGNYIGIIAKFNWRSKDLHMPGLYKSKAFSKGFEMGTQEVINIELLKFQKCLFYEIRTMISSQMTLPFFPNWAGLH